MRKKKNWDKSQNGKPSNKKSGRPQRSKNFRNKGKASAKKNGRGKSTIDPALLVRAAQPVEEQAYQPQFKFDHMHIHEDIKRNLRKIGFEYPTEIQDRTYEDLVQKTDLIGIANTGTGKTGAFLLPIIQRLMVNPKKRFQSLVILPTRELALQVQDEFNKMTKGLKLFSSCHIGGTNIATDFKRLRRFQHIVIGTPGRLLDLQNKDALRLENFEVLVLDEFDRMLDMGFIHDIRQLVEAMTSREHTMLFSATKDPKQQKVIDEIITNPTIVEVSSGNSTSKNVDQDVVRLSEGQSKFQELLKIVQDEECTRVLLFVETKRYAHRLCRRLNDAGVPSDQIHGDKSQNYRVQALSRFKRGKVKILVATDVAARGIDVKDISHVINFQMPRDYDTYIHRIGRTGRAGNTGKALTFLESR